MHLIKAKNSSTGSQSTSLSKANPFRTVLTVLCPLLLKMAEIFCGNIETVSIGSLYSTSKSH